MSLMEEVIPVDERQNNEGALQTCELVQGYRVPVRKKGTAEWKLGEIVAIREYGGVKQYYVHYLDYNKRLDEWVTIEDMDVSRVICTPPNDRKDRDRPGGGGYAKKSMNRKKKLISHTSSALDSNASFDSEILVESVPTTGGFRSSYERAHADAVTRVKNMQTVQIGCYRIKPWYFSPYPIELVNLDCVFLCEWCLKPTKSQTCLNRHMDKCPMMHPPGNEIYRNDGISVFEIDGRKNKCYVQNLCLLSKLFLDHKTVFYDTEPFLFYVLTEYNINGHHIVGYFSKEKESSEDFNLACILTLPQYQRKGYGRLLIELSYCLSRLDNRKGHPEKPFSDLGLLSYRSYWSFAVMEVIMSRYERHDNNSTPQVTVSEICDATSIRKEDVISTLHHLKLVSYYKGTFVICLTKEPIENFHQQKARRTLRIDTSRLLYKPKEYAKL